MDDSMVTLSLTTPRSQYPCVYFAAISPWQRKAGEILEWQKPAPGRRGLDGGIGSVLALKQTFLGRPTNAAQIPLFAQSFSPKPGRPLLGTLLSSGSDPT
jgi:hypothetical protein